MSEEELTSFRMWQLIGAGVSVWLVSFAVRKFTRINLYLSYLLSIIFCGVVAAILSPLPGESAIACVFVGAFGWFVESCISKRKSPQQPPETPLQKGIAGKVL